MNHLPLTTKAPLAIVGSVLLAVVLATPAGARQDPSTGDGAAAPGLPYSQHAYENHYLSPLPEQMPRVAQRPAIRVVDDGSLELFQVGAGLLAGMALAGAGMAAASRRAHAHAQPV